MAKRKKKSRSLNSEIESPKDTEQQDLHESPDKDETNPRDKAFVYLGVNQCWLNRTDEEEIRRLVTKFVKSENVAFYIGGVSVYIGWNEPERGWILKVLYTADHKTVLENKYERRDVDTAVAHWVYYSKHYQREYENAQEE